MGSVECACFGADLTTVPRLDPDSRCHLTDRRNAAKFTFAVDDDCNRRRSFTLSSYFLRPTRSFLETKFSTNMITFTKNWNRSIGVVPACVFLLSLTTSPCSWAQTPANTWCQEAKLNEGSASNPIGFGESVAIDTIRLVVGAPGSPAGIGAGSVFIYKKDPGYPANNGWHKIQTLTESSGTTNNGFGACVAMSGDILIIGAPWNNNNTGTVEIHSWNGNGFQHIQTLNGSLAGDHFGDAVAFDGNHVVVGASKIDKVFVYDWNGTTASNKKVITPLIQTSGDSFGYSVAVHLNWIVVGAPRHSAGGIKSGAAFPFEFDPGSMTWVQRPKFFPSDPVTDDEFGVRVSIDNTAGKTVVVGAHQHDHGGVINTGAAYVFELDVATGTWGQPLELLPSVNEFNGLITDTTTDDFYGNQVTVDGLRIAVGAPRDLKFGYSSGQVDVYTKESETWIKTHELYANDAIGIKSYGAALDLFADELAIGAGHNAYVDAYKPLLGISALGTGTAGCSGAHELYATVCPVVGNSLFHIKTSNAPFGLPGLGIVSMGVNTNGYLLSNDPQCAGCPTIVMNVDLAPASQPSYFDLLVDTSMSAIGPISIPNDSTLVGQNFYLQCIFAEAGPDITCTAPQIQNSTTSYAVSSSNCLVITIQP